MYNGGWQTAPGWIRVLWAGNGSVSNYAGSATLGRADGPALRASFIKPIDLAWARDGRLIIADHFMGIRVVSAGAAASRRVSTLVPWTTTHYLESVHTSDVGVLYYTTMLVSRWSWLRSPVM
jgi:hypothetical protein